jgi:ribosomal protein L5
MKQHLNQDNIKETWWRDNLVCTPLTSTRIRKIVIHIIISEKEKDEMARQ